MKRVACIGRRVELSLLRVRKQGKEVIIHVVLAHHIYLVWACRRLVFESSGTVFDSKWWESKIGNRSILPGQAAGDGVPGRYHRF